MDIHNLVLPFQLFHCMFFLLIGFKKEEILNFKELLHSIFSNILYNKYPNNFASICLDI